MELLQALALLVLAACATACQSPTTDYWADHDGLRGRSGTDICTGCLLKQEVKLGDERIVYKESKSDCSRWVRREFPDHRHKWLPVGCWFRDDRSVVCEINSWLVSLRPDDWLAYLQSMSRSHRRELVGRAGTNREAARELARECEEWVAERGAATTASSVSSADE